MCGLPYPPSSREHPSCGVDQPVLACSRETALLQLPFDGHISNMVRNNPVILGRSGTSFGGDMGSNKSSLDVNRPLTTTITTNAFSDCLTGCVFRSYSSLGKAGSQWIFRRKFCQNIEKEAAFWQNAKN